MAVDEDRSLAEEVASSLLAHQTLVHMLFSTLERKGVISPEEIDGMYFTAMNALEIAEKDGNPALFRRARQILETTSRNRARAPMADLLL
jgi:DNA-binding IclR family transcriptional regulator